MTFGKRDYIMGATNSKTGAKTSPKTGAKPGRKATFTTEGKGKDRIFKAINKRAHTVCKKAGKRSKISVAELKKLKGAGTYKFYAYTETGDLKAIRF